MPATPRYIFDKLLTKAGGRQAEDEYVAYHKANGVKLKKKYTQTK